MSSDLKITGKILSVISVSIQIYSFININKIIDTILIKIIFNLLLPLFFLISSFTVFYFVNLIYNIICPVKWINRDSCYLIYDEPNLKISNDIEHNLSKDYEDYERKYYESEFYENKNEKIILTIQIPVYTEDFNNTLKETFNNMIETMNYYNSNNLDKINIFINDDGLQKIDKEKQVERIEYYNKTNNLFYVARPVEGRIGKFKKASNMNFCIRQYLCCNKDKNIWEKNSLLHNFSYKKSNCETFKIGEFILLFDSDSRMDMLSINKIITDIKEYKNIGYMQFKTNSTISCKNNKWEKIIGHFTDSLYEINFLYSCSNGFPSPLVGHNCILKFDAIMEVEKYRNNRNNKNNENNNENNYNDWKAWDENRVSEDFVMCIYLLDLNYSCKYVYYDCGMQEGVTLNIVDEIIKFKKYMFGINEIIFNPINEWIIKGPISNIFYLFITSKNISIFTKYAIICYMGSYYAIVFGPTFSILYFISKLTKINNSNIFIFDVNYLLLTCIIVFYVLSTCCNIFIKYKNKNVSLKKLVLNEMYYGLMLTFFFGFLSFHLSISCVDYFCNFNVSWGSTNKEQKKINIVEFITYFKLIYICYLIIFVTVTIINVYVLINFKSNLLIDSVTIYIIIFLNIFFPLHVLN